MMHIGGQVGSGIQPRDRGCARRGRDDVGGVGLLHVLCTAKAPGAPFSLPLSLTLALCCPQDLNHPFLLSLVTPHSPFSHLLLHSPDSTAVRLLVACLPNTRTPCSHGDHKPAQATDTAHNNKLHSATSNTNHRRQLQTRPRATLWCLILCTSCVPRPHSSASPPSTACPSGSHTTRHTSPLSCIYRHCTLFFTPCRFSLSPPVLLLLLLPPVPRRGPLPRPPGKITKLPQPRSPSCKATLPRSRTVLCKHSSGNSPSIKTFTL